MGWFGNILKGLAPIAGSALGSVALPALGSGLGLDISGGLGGALGGALAGGLTNKDHIAGATTGGLEGYFLGPAIDSALGLNTATSLTSPSSPGSGGLGNALEFGGGDYGAGSTNPDGLNLSLDWNGAPGAGGAGGGGIDSILGGIGGGATGAGDALGNLASAAGNAASGGAAGAGTGSGGLMDIFSKNPALLMGLVAGGSQLLGGGQTAAEQKLQKQAKEAAAGANGLVTAASTGQLPAGAQAAWQSALDDTLTSIKSKYANLGLSGSTMEAQELSAAQERAAGLKYQMATEATQTGLSALGLSNQIYAALMQNQLQSDQGLSNAIGNFAGALGGGQGTQKVA